jgi:hypothetical protein
MQYMTRDQRALTALPAEAIEDRDNSVLLPENLTEAHPIDATKG